MERVHPRFLNRSAASPMIHYQLRCNEDHAFDGWFKSSDAFDRQARMGLVECPSCGSTKVNRALMAPSVAKRRRDAPKPGPAPGPTLEADGKPAPAPTPPAVVPDVLRAMLQRLRTEVERNCEDVGADFAQEARRIHRGESERRGIYGDATPEQAEALADEGIEVARIPWVPRADG